MGAVTWSDCGDETYHGKTVDLQPATIPATAVGGTLIGHGPTDIDVEGGTYDLHITASAGLVDQHFTGDMCEPKTFQLPMGSGSLTWGGFKCPASAGDDTEISIGLSYNAVM